jgi:hypothetical protein
MKCYPSWTDFLGYNQIMITKEDQDKKTITCAWGTYYWIMMPFGLRNVGATYQREMTLIFHYMMHKIVEDYVDDILSTSKKKRDHIEVLSQIFDWLAEYKVRLNPKKCVFGVTLGKLLGYTISIWGIELDPVKVKEIIDMEAPRTLKQW